MQYAKAASFAWSFRRELGIVFGTLAILIILPLLAMIGLMNNGVLAASDTLVSVNPVTHQVEVKDANGKVVTTMQATTTWPVKGTISQEFGVPNLPYEKAHTGIDIAAPRGTPITAALAGTVSAAGAVSQACGLCVYIDHGNGISSAYLHMSEVKAAKGQQVKPGDIIGLVGETGWAHGDHVHFMIMVYKIPINPRVFMIGNP